MQLEATTLPLWRRFFRRRSKYLAIEIAGWTLIAATVFFAIRIAILSW